MDRPTLLTLACLLLPSVVGAGELPPNLTPAVPDSPQPRLVVRPLPPPPRPDPPPQAPIGRLLLSLAWDQGLYRLPRTMSPGAGGPSLAANSGLLPAVGLIVAPRTSFPLETQLSTGLKYDTASNAKARVRYAALPIEALIAWAPAPFRLGLGASAAFAPRVTGSSGRNDLRNSVGLLTQGEVGWRVLDTRARFSCGLRLLWQRLRNDTGGASTPAATAGLLTSLAF